MDENNMSSHWTLKIVVPTRNRADLAAMAVESVLDAGLPSVRIMISDNSTEIAQKEQLATRSLGTPVEYVQPPKPLAMAAHWEWALAHALRDSAVTHVAFLTDRMSFQDGGLRALTHAVTRWPTKVISYAHDRVQDYRRPVELEQAAWSGRVLDVSSGLFVSEMARAKQSMGMAMPRLLNSAVPRAVLDQVRRRFGVACGNSTSPDFAFAFRCLAVVDSIHFYDRPVVIHYAMDRSNGASVARGLMSQDHADFIGDLKGDILTKAPLPGIVTVFNAIVEEYCAVRSEADWPQLDIVPYLETLQHEVDQMEAGPRKQQMLERISHFATSPQVHRTSTAGGSRTLRRVRRNPAHLAQRVWLRLLRTTGSHTGHAYPPVRVTQCLTREDAIAFARSSPRHAHRFLSSLELVVGSDARPPAITRVGAIRT